MCAEFLNLLLHIYEVDSDALKEISRKTNLVTSIILIIVGIVFLALVIYLVYLHITTKKPKRSVQRFNGYKTATAKITDIEMVSYFVQPYQYTPEKTEEVDEYINNPTFFRKGTNIPSSVRHNPIYREVQMEKLERNRMIEKQNFRKSIGEPENKKDEIEKIRFKVRYEFSTDSNNLYSGECFVYEKNDNIEVGKTIEIKYDSTNPMANFSAFSAPVGTQ